MVEKVRDIWRALVGSTEDDYSELAELGFPR